MMKVSPTLRLIYTTVGDTIYVVDVVERATLSHFAARKSDMKVRKAEGKKGGSKAVARKAPDAVEK